LLLSISSCANKKKNLNEFEVESYFTMGHYGELINDLDKKVQEDPENQLIHLLNLALAHQANGDYHQSNKVLLKIKELLRWNHILTLKEESLSLFLNENFKKLQVAEYEQLLVQFYITLNFAVLNN